RLVLGVWDGGARWCLGEPGSQLLGSMEGEDRATAGVGVEEAGEARLDAGRLVGERQRQPGDGQPGRETLTVLGTLYFDADEGLADLLGLDHAHGPPVDDEEVVGRTSQRRELTEGDPTAGAQVEVGAVLHDPAGQLQEV